MKKVILTGDRPTGKLHLGHYAGSLANRVRLQDEFQQYVMVADIQALTDNFETPDKIIENVNEVVLDYLSIGIDPVKSTIFIQSQIPELAELTIYYLNLVTLARLERNPTVKTEIQQKKYDLSIPAGFFCYPVSQAADITAFKADFVPVGEDQVPMIEQTNEIVRKFNRIYNTNCLKETKVILSKNPRLVGIDGQSKASKSLGNAIYLSDSADEIKRKVFLMYTDPGHLRITDPGKVEGNVVFTYLDAFHTDQEEIESLKNQYRKGGLGDSVIKNLLTHTLQTMLEPIRDKRNSLKSGDVIDILMTGTKAAREVAKNTVEEVRQSIGFRYFG
jgi:tryptophanyl-tRNA synthetase